MKRTTRIMALLMVAAMVLSLLGAVAEQVSLSDDLAADAPALEVIGQASTEGEEDDVLQERIEDAEADSEAGDLVGEPADDAFTPDEANSDFGMDGDTLVVYGGTAEDVLVPDGVKIIGPVAFCQLPNLRSVTIPTGVERISSYAFADCEKLEEVVLPEGLKVIEDHAFQNCPELKRIVLPEGLESIGNEAFQGCEALGDVAIPESVSSIGESVFPEQEITAEGNPDSEKGVPPSDGEVLDGDSEAEHDDDGEEETFHIINPIETLAVKESYILKASQDGQGNVWSSSDERYVKIINSATGEIKGVKKGVATVTVKSADGQTASININVLAAPSKVSLSAKKGTLGVNETVLLTAKLPKKTASQLTWTSSNQAVAKVENGLVTAVAAGKAKITAQTFNKKKASYTVTVKAEPEKLEVPELLALGVGQKYTLNVALTPSTAAGKLKITNTNQFALKLDKTEFTVTGKASIKLTALAVGNTTLKFELYNGLTAECEVRVCAVPTQLQIVNAVANLGVKEEYQLQAESNTDPALMMHAKWKSSNKKIIQVDAATGKLTAKKKGTATITVTLPKGKKTIKKSVKIKVITAPSWITLNRTSVELKEGSSVQLRATVPDKTASQIKWESDDETVATVKYGLVKGVGDGFATITATTFNGYRAQCMVTVEGAGAPHLTINGEATSSEVPEIHDKVTLAWECADEVLGYNFEIVDESGTSVLKKENTTETTITFARGQLSSGVTYTVTVSAIREIDGAQKISSKRARFTYIDLSAGFEFVDNGEGITITKYTGSASDVVVPDQIDGKIVTRIATGAFNGDNCAKINRIAWPQGVVFEEDSVAGLKGCADSNGFLVFSNTLCEYFGSAENITIPSGVIRINDGAFAQNATIASVKVPNTVEVIGARAFEDCIKLSTMTTY